ncbi:MAG: glycerol-3-phosphate responsive antiterminator [Firmicutes bacterium]|nr:glycerol-3-phosphate responsive antiterminator [Bacillota bacterium]
MDGRVDAVLRWPVIAALREDRDLRELERHRAVATAFILWGDLLQLPRIVGQCKALGKAAFLHLDLVRGLAAEAEAVEYIARVVRPDGLITTKARLIPVAREFGLLAIQRVFALDSKGFHTAVQMAEAVQPDAVEVLPGVVPRAIARLREALTCPIVAGGLIETGADVEAALAAGARAVSVSRHEVWRYRPTSAPPGTAGGGRNRPAEGE